MTLSMICMRTSGSLPLLILLIMRVINVWENATMEKGNGGGFISHLGTDRFLGVSTTDISDSGVVLGVIAV